MSRIKKIASGGFYIFSGHAAGQVFNLIRNLAVARLVAPEDFGIALTFALTIAILQMASDLGLNKLIIQSEKGDDPAFQDMAHAILVLRGFILAAIIFLCGGVAARAFGAPDAEWAYRYLAIVPLIRGFDHLDINRIQRQLNFRSEINVTLISQILATLATIGFAFALRDYSAMLWGVIVQAIAYTIGSHIAATRPYSLKWSLGFAKTAAGFSLPLMVNGLVLFASGQGDRMLIGTTLGLTALAIYGAATMITGSVSQIVIRVTGALALPLLAEVQSQSEKFKTRYELLGPVIGLIAVSLAIPLIFFGADIVTLVFGTAYTSPKGMFIVLAATLPMWLLQFWPTMGSLARGDTLSVMFVNIVRSSGILLGAITIYHGGNLLTVALSMAVGEIFGIITAIIRFNGKNERSILKGIGSVGMSLGLILLAALTAYELHDLNWILRVALSLIALAVSSTCFFLYSKQLRKAGLQVWQHSSQFFSERYFKP